MSTAAPAAIPTQVVILRSKAAVGPVAAAILAPAATAVFDGNTGIHEFVRDTRHFLGFPCH